MFILRKKGHELEKTEINTTQKINTQNEINMETKRKTTPPTAQEQKTTTHKTNQRTLATSTPRISVKPAISALPATVTPKTITTT
jgi:hypothetical protein